MSKLSNAEKLRRELSRPAVLSLEAAERRLPDLAMAEAAGLDVAADFADVLEAIGRYPQLAEAYEQLLEDLEALLDAPDIPEPAARNPGPAAAPTRLTDPYTLRMLDRPDRFLIQLKPAAQPPATRLRGGLDLLHLVVPELPGQPELRVSLRPHPGQRWQLVVAIRTPGGGQPWRVSALVDHAELAAPGEPEDGELRFRQLFAYPSEPIVLFFNVADGAR